jgi:sodium/proline symporter
MDFVLIGFIVYLVGVLLVGALTFKFSKTQEDFLIGGKKLGAWVIAFSERASGESAWLLLGLPGAALTIGLGEVWAAVGCVTGIIISWIVIAQRLRQEVEDYDSLTLPAYFSKKFGGESKSIQIIATIIIIFFFAFYVAAQFSGAGKVLNVTFGIPHVWGIVLGATIIVLYTLMGGFFAVAWTDFIQGIIMIGTLVILPIVGYIEFKNQGTTTINQALMNLGSSFASWTGGKNGIWAFLFVLGGLSWGFGYMGQPHLILRYMALKSPEDAKKSRVIAIAWAIPAFAGAFLIGILGVTLFQGQLFDDPEKLMPFMATQLLPSWLAGIFISGAIAAMMSTADSQLLVMTSAITEDIYHSVMGKNPSQRQLVTISRLATVAIGAIAFIMALTTKELVFYMVSYAWSGLGASFGPIILFSLFWKKLNKAGVIAGMLTGSLSTVIWKNISALNDIIPERFISFVLACLAIVIVTLLTQNNKES